MPSLPIPLCTSPPILSPPFLCCDVIADKVNCCGPAWLSFVSEIAAQAWSYTEMAITSASQREQVKKQQQVIIELIKSHQTLRRYQPSNFRERRTNNLWVETLSRHTSPIQPQTPWHVVDVVKVDMWRNWQQCPAREATCHKCHKRGHFQSLCWTKSVKAVSTTDLEEDNGDDLFVGVVKEPSLLTVLTISSGIDPWTVNIFLNECPVKFQIDTGADVSVISEDQYQKLKTPGLQPSSKSLMGSSRDKLYLEWD